MFSRPRPIAFAVAAFALSSSAASAQQVRYRITALSDLTGSLTSFPYAINSGGQAVGDVQFEDGILNELAARWSDDQSTLLQLLPDDTRGIARGINRDGIAVGASSLVRIEMVGHQIHIFETARAVLWAADQPTDLNTLVTSGDTLNLIRGDDINDAGVIVGAGLVAMPPPDTSPWHAFLFDHGVLHDLNILMPDATSTRTSEAWAVNAAGLVVGVSDSPLFPVDNGHEHAVRWDLQKDGSYTITDLHHLPPIAGLASHAYDCNDLGWIVGDAQFNVSHPEEPALWRNGSVELLPNLGFTQGAGYSVNNRGFIAGQTFFDTGEARAVLWRNGQVYDLTTMIPQDQGWDRLSIAWDINQRGEIIGVGSRNGVPNQGFILTPLCDADWNFDGVVNSQDLFDYVGDFFGGGPAADFTDDGTVNSQDFFVFLAAFFSGCG